MLGGEERLDKGIRGVIRPRERSTTFLVQVTPGGVSGGGVMGVTSTTEIFRKTGPGPVQHILDCPSPKKEETRSCELPREYLGLVRNREHVWGVWGGENQR